MAPIRYMLDTNICIALIRRRGGSMLKRIAQCRVGDVGLSAITLAELEYGVAKSAKTARNYIALCEFCAPLEIRPFDDAAATAYGRIRADLERTGQIIGPMDLLIAAHAVAEDATMVTNNEREFRRVKELRVENWL